MNKTVTANISGVVFHIESSAYDHLHNYLNTIRTYFKDAEGKDEIMADIEARIAELFKEHLDEGKEVITLEHVKQVISVMGEPEQYMDEVDAEEIGSGSKSARKEAFYSKKLYRDPDDNVLGGVCAGIGHYFGVDKIWFRVAFLVAVFGFGTGVLLYLILWIIIPSAKTTAEKLEMKGEPVTVDNIGNAIKDEFGNFKKKVNNGDTVKYRSRAENAIYRFFEFIGRILLFLFKFIVKLIAVILVLIGISGLIGVIALLIGGPINMSFDDSSVETYWFSDISDLVFASDFMYVTGLIGLILVMTIPLLGILYGGVKILFDIPKTNRAVGLTALSLWAIGIIMVIIATTNTVSQFASKQTIEEEIILTELSSDTLILARMGNSYGDDGLGSIFLEDGKIKTNDLSIDVVRSKNDKVRMLVDKSSKGRVRKEAGKRAENIELEYRLENNRIEVSPLIAVPVEDKYRKQEVEISIALPVGVSIYLDPTSRDIIYDIKNVTNTYDGRMMAHHWLMTEEGLKCTDCTWMEEENIEQTEQQLRKEAERLSKEAEMQARKARELKRKAEKLRKVDAALDADEEVEL
jgi:phage shock protein PspC (stress-responsive transcriptional regulator)